MCVCVCVCVCMFILYVCMYVCMYVNMYVNMYVAMSKYCNVHSQLLVQVTNRPLVCLHHKAIKQTNKQPALHEVAYRT